MAGHAIDPALYRPRDVVPVRRALLSVSDKSGLLELAAALAEAGVEIVSTGSTASTIAEAGHPVTEVASVTGFREALDGRVKTLHPGVHAGILADLRLEDHERQLDELGIAPFELVVVNLYPFVETVASGAERATPRPCGASPSRFSRASSISSMTMKSSFHAMTRAPAMCASIFRASALTCANAPPEKKQT